MAFLKIGDLDLGITYGYSVTRDSLDKKIRMASGKLVTEIVGYKWKIAVKYKYLTEAQRIDLFSKLANIPANGIAVEFYNPSGQIEAGLFTIGDIPSAKIAKFTGTVPSEWSDVSFNLEEV